MGVGVDGTLRVPYLNGAPQENPSGDGFESLWKDYRLLRNKITQEKRDFKKSHYAAYLERYHNLSHGLLHVQDLTLF